MRAKYWPVALFVYGARQQQLRPQTPNLVGAFRRRTHHAAPDDYKSEVRRHALLPDMRLSGSDSMAEEIAHPVTIRSSLRGRSRDYSPINACTLPQ